MYIMFYDMLVLHCYKFMMIMWCCMLIIIHAWMVKGWCVDVVGCNMKKRLNCGHARLVEILVIM